MNRINEKNKKYILLHRSISYVLAFLLIFSNVMMASGSGSNTESMNGQYQFGGEKGQQGVNDKNIIVVPIEIKDSTTSEGPDAVAGSIKSSTDAAGSETAADESVIEGTAGEGTAGEETTDESGSQQFDEGKSGYQNGKDINEVYEKPIVLIEDIYQQNKDESVEEEDVNVIIHEDEATIVDSFDQEATGGNGQKGKPADTETKGSNREASDTRGGSQGITIKVPIGFLENNGDNVSNVQDLPASLVVYLEKKAEDEVDSEFHEVIVDILNGNEIIENPTAILQIAPGGTCELSYGDVTGYRTPESQTISLTKLSGSFTVIAEKASYFKNNNQLTGIEINKEKLTLLKGFGEQLSATLLPDDVRPIQLSWRSSSDVVDCTVDGYVTANAKGIAIITAIGNVDGSKVEEDVTISNITDECEVEVQEIASVPIVNYSEEVTTGVLIELPGTIGIAVKEPHVHEPISEAPVKWNDAIMVNGVQMIAFLRPGINQQIVGRIDGYDDLVYMNFNVVGEELHAVYNAILVNQTMSAYIGQTVPLSLYRYSPMEADLESLLWISENPAIATVKSIIPGMVGITGISAGKTIINLRSMDGFLLDSCQVNVAIDPGLTDDVYLMATEEESYDSVDQFEEADDVFIRGFGFKEKTYYIKIDDKKSNLLISGKEFVEIFLDDESTDDVNPTTEENVPIVQLVNGEFKFNLSEVTNGFRLTEQNSAAYYVYMSAYSEFPHGDETDGITPKTVVDNFKIGSPVPEGKLKVTIQEIINGELVDNPTSMEGCNVILARETGIDPLLATMDTYRNQFFDGPFNDNEFLDEDGDKLYNDEVKRYGNINDEGTIDWVEENVESLKIGGYILLAELPEGYISNLNSYYVNSEDGELVKEVHLVRYTDIEDLVTREIIVQKLPILIGLDKQNIDIFTDSIDLSERSDIISVLNVPRSIELPELEDLRWVIEDETIATIGAVSSDNSFVEVKALSPGVTLINLTDGTTIYASCMVTVVNDPALMDSAYIMGTLEESEISVDQFESPDKVWISCFNLPEGFYKVKIEDKKSILHEDIYTIDVDPNENGYFTFNLYSLTDFRDTDMNSKEYFVSMTLSTNDGYPTGDDETTLLPNTFKDNFKITSPVPTGGINVKINQLVDGEFKDLNFKIDGSLVLLAREVDAIEAKDITFEDYINPHFDFDNVFDEDNNWVNVMSVEDVIALGIYYDGDNNKLFNDEVKNIGFISVNGTVTWADTYSSESLKIGGYNLVIVLPDTFISDSHELNPDAEDGELLIQLSIRRDVIAERVITIQELNTPVCGHCHGIGCKYCNGFTWEYYGLPDGGN